MVSDTPLASDAELDLEAPDAASAQPDLVARNPGAVKLRNVVQRPHHPESSPAPGGERSDRLVRNIGALAVAQAVTWTMTLIWTAVVPRALGPAGLGLIVSAQSVAGILSIALGLANRSYLVKEIVIDRQAGPTLLGTALVLRLMLVPVVAIGAIVWVRFTHYSREATVVLYLITTLTILVLLAEPFHAGFQAIERMKYMAYADVIYKSAQCIIGIALVMIGFKAIGVAANMAIMAAVALALNALWLRRYIRIDPKTNAHQLTRMAKESAVYFTTGVFGSVYLWIDTVMLTLMTQPRVVGWYAAPTQLFQTLMFLPVLVSTAWLPRLVAAFAQHRDRLAGVAQTPAEFVLVISIPIATGTAMFAHVVIPAIYGPTFAEAVPVMVVLAFCIPAIYLNIVLAQILLAAKRQPAWTVVILGAAVFNPLINLVLIPLTQHHFHNGAVGAAISLVFTETLMDVVGFVLVGRVVLGRRALRRSALAIVASAGMWGVSYVAAPLGAPVSLAAAVATLLLLSLALRVVTSDEIALARSAVERLRARLLRFGGGLAEAVGRAAARS